MRALALEDELSPNGTAPLNICISTKRGSTKVQHVVDLPWRTSIITMAKEKMSACLVYGLASSSKISGAVHRGL